MKLRHGKVLTKEREQLVQDYKMRRAMWQGVTAGIPMRTLLEPREDYMDWIRGFERFMCRGLTEIKADTATPADAGAVQRRLHALVAGSSANDDSR